jgi:hypothetical protein
MFFGVTGKNTSRFWLPTLSLTLLPVLSPVPDTTLRPTPRPAQKQWAIGRLWYWQPVVVESGTWVFVRAFPLQLLNS